MDGRERCHQVSVALVGDEHNGAAVSNAHVAAADAHIGVNEGLPKLSPCHLHQFFDVGRLRFTGLLAE